MEEETSKQINKGENNSDLTVKWFSLISLHYRALNSFLYEPRPYSLPSPT